MQADFWHARWANNQIGFHLDEVNPYLMRHLSRLRLQAGEQVLVPLCGKTLDLAWLAAQGLDVLGVELSEKAVSDFFAENGLQPAIDQLDGFRRYRAAGITLLQGDFFALQSGHLAGCRAFYDRAALIALPPDMRERYAGHLQAILPARSLGLLVTIDYPQGEMAWPPFAVPDAEVREHYAAGWRIEELERG
ncbi:thiopurine S-methyltransferase, partial [Pseudomonas aeruginosa]